jgi:transcriptional regulator with XRE-family HTH domain
MKPHPLKVERELRGWSQSKVAELLGTTTRTVRRWERGDGIPYPHYREQLCILFGKDAYKLGMLPGTDEACLEIPAVDITPDSLASFPSPESTRKMHSPKDRLFSHRSLKAVGLGPIRDGLRFRPFKRFPRRSRLIGLSILFPVFIITIILSAFTLPLFFKSAQIMTIPSTQTPPSIASSVISYEAEASQNVRTGRTKSVKCAGCSGKRKVGYIGKNNTLQFNNVFKSSAGNYKLTIHYIDGDAGRTLYMSVNGDPGTALYAPGANNDDWQTNVLTLSVTVHLNAGSNTIKFYNSSSKAPDLDRIVV